MFLYKESESFCGMSLRPLGQISRSVNFTCESCSPCEVSMGLFASRRNGEGSILVAAIPSLANLKGIPSRCKTALGVFVEQFPNLEQLLTV